MDKKAQVMKLMELFKLLEERTALITRAIKLICAEETESFLANEYQWIYDQFEEPEDISNSVPEYFMDGKIEELVALYKG